MSDTAELFSEVRKRAWLSPCGRYRYTLTREWDSLGKRLLFIMLNPSTADALIDDPTITRCVTRASALGYGSIEVVNLFAWRATDPLALRSAVDPVGPENDWAIEGAKGRAHAAIIAWGKHGTLKRRDREVLRLLQGIETYHLGLNKDGTPKHPLYVSYAVQPTTTQETTHAD